MKNLLTIAIAMVFALAAGLAYADEMPTTISTGKDIGLKLSEDATHVMVVKGVAAEGRVFARYADFPTITDLKNRELGTVLSNSFVIHEAGMKGAAAGGLGAQAGKDSIQRTYLGPGGSDLP